MGRMIRDEIEERDDADYAAEKIQNPSAVHRQHQNRSC